VFPAHIKNASLSISLTNGESFENVIFSSFGAVRKNDYTIPQIDLIKPFMILGKTSLLTNNRYSSSFFVVSLMSDFLATVLSVTFKRATIGLFISLADLNATAVSISMELHPVLIIVSTWANSAKIVSVQKVLPICHLVLVSLQIFSVSCFS
jgi:hypothetical protein